MNGHSEPTPIKSWPLKSHIEEQEDTLHPTSQSWPPAPDIPARSSFETAGESLGHTGSQSLEETFDEDALENNVDSPWSPAAAFLSAFLSSTPPPSDPSRQVIAGYDLGPIIGYGGFSTIRQATSPSGGVVAVKIVRHTAFDNLPPGEKARQRSRLSHEARVWVSLSHENILPLFDSHRTSDAQYLITLYCPAGSLLDILKREGTPALEQTDAGCMFRQVVKALQYLHLTKGLVHGDIKLENVLVDESGVCRLTDFGLTLRIGSSQVSSGSEEDCEEASPKKPRDRSRRAGTTGLPVHLSLMRHGPQRHRNSSPSLSTAAPLTHPDHMFQPGSLPYAAPELLLPHSCCTNGGNGHSRRPTAHPAQDMWALGVLLYTLLTGTLPFRDLFEPRLQMKILRGLYEIPPGIGRLAESVLRGCLTRDVNDRWTITMVDDASWGIGYDNIDVNSNLREDERSGSQSHAPSCECPPSCSDLPESMSSLSLGCSPPANTSMSCGRPPRLSVRSRSPSPSVAPRTPEDDEDEAVMFFGRHVSLFRPHQGDSGDVRIFSAEEQHKWESRDPTYHGKHEGTSPDAVRLPLGESKLDCLDGLQEKQDEEGLQSRTLSWPLDGRTR